MRRVCVILALLALVCLSACSKKKDDPKTGIQVQFSAAPISGPAPLTVQFTDESVGSGMSVWHWNFGDGSTSTVQNPSHTYANAGSYNVTLSVSNALGSETLTKPEYVVVTDGGGIIDPTAFHFEPSEVTVSPGETVNFTLVNGISPYQVGYVDAADIQSYDDPSQIQGQLDPNVGSGYYVVGSNNDCTDRLAAVDSDGALCYLTITVGTGGEPGPGPGPDPGPLPGSPNADETEVFNLVNDERQKAGRAALQWCEGLYNCAKAHSCDMCDRGFFDHVNPEGEGPTDRARAGHAGSYTFAPIVPNPYAWIGENIAHGYTSAAAVMNGWMNSAGHRANILDPDYTHIGIGQCEGCRTHWTQTFGTR